MSNCPSTGEPILGPLLFLVMVADMPKYVIGEMKSAKMMAYADDSTIYSKGQIFPNGYLITPM